MMKTSDRGIAAIVQHEGIVPAPYLDSVGVWTYGIGHTASAGAPDPTKLTRGMPVDMDTALRAVFDVFRADLPKYEARVNKHIKVPLSQHEFDALVSFDFNTGGIYYYNKKTRKWANADLVTKLNAGDRVGAAAAFMNWTKPASIADRRKEEMQLFRTGVYPTRRAAVWPVNDKGRITWKPERTLSAAQILAYLRPDEQPKPQPKPDPVPSTPAPAPQPASSPWSLAALLAAFLAIFTFKRNN